MSNSQTKEETGANSKNPHERIRLHIKKEFKWKISENEYQNRELEAYVELTKLFMDKRSKEI